MRFRHILPEELTELDAELLDKSRAISYDDITMAQLGKLIGERYMDVWKIEGLDAIVVTSFTHSAKGKQLEVNFFAGRRCSAHRMEISLALKALAKELGCVNATFTTKRGEGFARAIGAEEVARVYEL